ncbi:hypothetical protein [Aeromonas hydrophila]|uniref:hypothetical protein n=1 Tax=Aeromonas hydrophila TaxID=644 RepID=UPI00214E124C|nr:hypothetical protein [Aeromonas hydrophila]MCR3952675.1 hypothetical protein [Aeromonas hydrophila]
MQMEALKRKSNKRLQSDLRLLSPFLPNPGKKAASSLRQLRRALAIEVPVLPSYIAKTYSADSDRGSSNEKVVRILLTSPEDVLRKEKNLVLECLQNAGVASSLGLYFYRFKNQANPLIKIGECTRKDGIAVRFERGWHGTEKYSDTYLKKKTNNGTEYVDSELFIEINKISEANPAYFVFYEHCTLNSHPKIDEIFAYRMHKRLFKKGTASPERMNSNPLLARRLVWHKKAFSEVVRAVFPDGTPYS